MSNIYDTAPARSALTVTPHATNALTNGVRGLYVGTTGNIAGRLVGDTADVSFVGVPAGSILPFKFSHVRATGTTASNILALY